MVPSPAAQTSSFIPSFCRADSGPAGPGSRALAPPLQAAPARTRGRPVTCEAVALGGWGGCPQSPGSSPFPKLPEQNNLGLPEAFPERISLSLLGLCQPQGCSLPGLLLASCLSAGLTSALPSLDDDMASFGPSCRYPELGQPTLGGSALISDYLCGLQGGGGAGRASPSSDVYPVSLESGSQGPRASGKWAPNSALHSRTWIWSRVWRLWWEAASVTGLRGFLCVPTGRNPGSGTTARALGLSCLSSLAGCPE